MKKIVLGLSIIISIVLPIFCLIYLYPKKIITIYGDDFCIEDSLEWGITEQSLEDGIYKLRGWIVYPGIKQGYAVLDNKSVWIYDIEESRFYKLKSQASSERDASVSALLNDGTDYRSSIFSCSVNISKLNISNHTFIIYFCYVYEGVNYLVQTNFSIVDEMIIAK